MKKYLCRLVFVVSSFLSIPISPISVDAQTSGFTLTPRAKYALPAGPNAGLFSYGASGTATGLFRFSTLPFSVGAGVDVTYAEQSGGAFFLDTAAGLVAETRLDLGTRFSLSLRVLAGLSCAVYEWGLQRPVAFNPALGASAAAHIALSPSLSMSVHAGYDYHALLNTVSFGLGTEIGLTRRSAAAAPSVEPAREPRPEPLADAAGGGAVVNVTVTRLEEVFPVFYKHYADHAVGLVRLENQGDTAITDVEASAFVGRYMDAPTKNSRVESIEPNESREVELFALFNESVLEVQESTKVTLQIEVEYRRGAEIRTVAETVPLRILDRNALTWDDDRKAAAFVSSKDASVMAVARMVSAIATKHTSDAINEKLAYAMGMHVALPHLGISYSSDPKTPYDRFSRTRDMIDYVQYPRQTLYYRSGDCDDLSILYCSLLEAVAVDTALVTTPGHIFVAFSLGMSTEDAARSYINTNDLITGPDGTAWVPLEVTLIDGSFLEALEEGARLWRDNKIRDTAGFYPLREAWSRYEPVGVPGGVEGIPLPETDSLRSKFLSEYDRFVNDRIFDQVSTIKEYMESRGETPHLLNKLGVMYASYALYDRARPYFERAVSAADYVPALQNLGNLCFLESDYEAALLFYTRSHQAAPEEPSAVLALARTHHEIGNYEVSRVHYDRLRSLDPDLAERYAYLDSRSGNQGRAAAAEAHLRKVIWVEELE